MLIKDVEVLDRGLADLRIRGPLIVAVRPRLDPAPGEEVIDGGGGALLPGLADHHLHLAAMAARENSLDLSTVGVDDLAETVGRHRTGADGWIRAVGYDEALHGVLDRSLLDRWTGGRPVRVQHRNRRLWVLNSTALRRLGSADHPGLERDFDGRRTGRLWGADDWLASRIGPSRPSPLLLRAVGARLAGYGITHVSDASPGSTHLAMVVGAVRTGALPQHLLVMAADAEPVGHPRITVGPVKLVLSDRRLPTLEAFAARVAAAHDRGRSVAVHCVSRASLVLTLDALDAAGQHPGDRIEHCGVAGPELAAALAARGLPVITQPTLLTGRGDDYLAVAAPEDEHALWPYASLIQAGVRTVPSSDAPYGDADPWASLRSATTRRTRSGRVVGTDERVPASVALRGMLTPLADPGGPVRRVAVGEPADLVLLDAPADEVLADPDAGRVVATLVEGKVVHAR